MCLESRNVLTLGVCVEIMQTLVESRVMKMHSEGVSVCKSNECMICRGHIGRCTGECLVSVWWVLM